MSKNVRMFSTHLFDDPWFCELPLDAKLIWWYGILKCDMAGFWKDPNPRLVGFVFDGKREIDWADATSRLQMRWHGEEPRLRIFQGTHLWYWTRFIEFQHGTQMANQDAPVAKGVVRTLQGWGFDYDFEAQAVTLNGHLLSKLPNGLPESVNRVSVQSDTLVLGLGLGLDKPSPESDPEAEGKPGEKGSEKKGGSGRRRKLGPAAEKTPLMRRVEGWFHRRPSTVWDAKELAAWARNRASIETTPGEDLALLDWWYEQPAGTTCRRRGLETLLNNWNTELSRAADTREAGATGSGDLIRVSGGGRDAPYKKPVYGEEGYEEPAINLVELWLEGDLGPVPRDHVGYVKKIADQRGLPWPGKVQLSP